VAADILAGFGGVMTKLTTTQAGHINVPFDGPLWSESFEY
jgi:adenosylhomocysteinase